MLGCLIETSASAEHLKRTDCQAGTDQDHPRRWIPVSKAVNECGSGTRLPGGRNDLHDEAHQIGL
ncbi:hypothetical protein, partial [Mesorhizobium sp.]|uniref:hypothetical protein n=1 Tax=Mesorhizobium sp. TaxID=1871066 RepID=UPI00257AD616